MSDTKVKIEAETLEGIAEVLPDTNTEEISDDYRPIVEELELTYEAVLAATKEESGGRIISYIAGFYDGDLDEDEMSHLIHVLSVFDLVEQNDKRWRAAEISHGE